MLLKEQMKIIRNFQQQAPVLVVKIARALGLRVFKSTLPENVSGMLKMDPNATAGYSIYVNQSHPDTRRRFTIAHEIGHFILHKNLLRDGIVEDALLRAEGLSNTTETEANSFAADILMPWNLIRQLQDNGINTIEGLAAELRVSTDAMSVRLIGVPYEQAKKMSAAE